MWNAPEMTTGQRQAGIPLEVFVGFAHLTPNSSLPFQPESSLSQKKTAKFG